MYSDAVKNDRFVTSTGSAAFDDLLGGGIYSGEITEISGHYSTGKSQMAMTLAVEAVIEGRKEDKDAMSLGQAWYLDSSSNFSSERIAEIVRYRLHPQDSVAAPEEQMKAVFEVLARLHVFNIGDPVALYNVLLQLNQELDEYHRIEGAHMPQVVPFHQAMPHPLMNLKLLVIDSLGVLSYPTVLGKASPMTRFGRSLLFEIGLMLKHIATTYNIAIVVINTTSTAQQKPDDPNPPPAPTIPALGVYWGRLPDVRIMLHYPYNEAVVAAGGRRAELRKSSHTKSRLSRNFSITRRGIDEPLGGE